MRVYLAPKVLVVDEFGSRPYDRNGDTVIVSAVLDRLLHHSHVLNIGGERFRLREKRQEGLFSSHHLLSGIPEDSNNHYPD